MKNKTIIICLIIIALGIMLTVKIVNNNTQSNLAQSKHSEKVNISEFKENLRKYFMAEKVANEWSRGRSLTDHIKINMCDWFDINIREELLANSRGSFFF